MNLEEEILSGKFLGFICKLFRKKIENDIFTLIYFLKNITKKLLKKHTKKSGEVNRSQIKLSRCLLLYVYYNILTLIIFILQTNGS